MHWLTLTTEIQELSRQAWILKFWQFWHLSRALRRAEVAIWQSQIHYQLPSLLPHHQATPMVAVFWCLLKVPNWSVRKNGTLEKSRRHSVLIRKPSANL